VWECKGIWQRGQLADRDGPLAGTLLNRLFGTKFDVMNENERRQTTKGAPRYCLLLMES
jgi:hypothetical protein